VCDHDFSVVTLAGYKCRKCGEQKPYAHDWDVLYDGLKDKKTGEFYACKHSSWEVTSNGFRCKTCGGEIKCSGHNWVGQEPDEPTGETHTFCNSCNKDMTLEGSSYDSSKHNCDNPPSRGKRTMNEHRTSAWTCSGGCGVKIRHWAQEDEYEYLYNVVDSKGNADTLSLGTPSQSVIKTLKFETKWW
ncbi:MAG: hypothetical protein MR625_02585, partial [Clostridium sp.]|nr:hypothetical protein [Clostridium sp.]